MNNFDIIKEEKDGVEIVKAVKKKKTATKNSD